MQEAAAAGERNACTSPASTAKMKKVNAMAKAGMDVLELLCREASEAAPDFLRERLRV